MPTRNDFLVEKCEDCIRITRVDIDGDKHCHCKSRKVAESIIENICDNKIPLHSHSRTLECMLRLSNNKKFNSKIRELLQTRARKGKKQSYFNPGVKKSF